MPEFINMIILILLVFLFLANITLHTSALLSYFIGGAPFLPTPITLLETMLALADIQSDELVYDLGCGDGRLLIEANLTYKAQAVGIEISTIFCWIARIKANFYQAVITVIQDDLMEFDFSNADVIFCYLMPEQLKQLKKKFSLLKKGCRIISLRFEVPGWKPLCHVSRNDRIQQPPIFKYQL